MDESGSTTGSGLNSKPQLTLWYQWQALSRLILEVLAFQARQGKNFDGKLYISENPKCFFIFAQWVWGSQIVLHKCIWSKMSNSIMILAPFFKDFKAKAYTVYWTPCMQFKESCMLNVDKYKLHL